MGHRASTVLVTAHNANAAYSMSICGYEVEYNNVIVFISL